MLEFVYNRSPTSPISILVYIEKTINIALKKGNSKKKGRKREKNKKGYAKGDKKARALTLIVLSNCMGGRYWRVLDIPRGNTIVPSPYDAPPPPSSLLNYIYV